MAHNRQTKTKVLDLKDTNVALIGSDIDHKCRLEASNGEPAWTNAGKKAGLEAWRVNKFKLEAVPEKVIGSFYDGDSYIVLHTVKTGNNFKYDIYFWLGKFTTQDEAGTAAYKTVELDDHLGTLPAQHREVQGHETSQFLQLFGNKGGVRILKGGYDTGFHHVEINSPASYQPRLLHIQGTTAKDVRAVEVEIKASSLNSSDCFILDAGLDIYQFNGHKSKPIERNKASQVSSSIEHERPSAKLHVSDEGDADAAPFWKFFGGLQKIAEEGHVEVAKPRSIASNDLFEMDIVHGKAQFKKIASGSINKSLLKSQHVFVLDTGHRLFVWVGNHSPKPEKKYALQKALDYINAHNLPPQTAVSRVPEGHETHAFLEVLVH